MKHVCTFTLLILTYCITNGQVPTLVGPPNIVVSCSFKFTTADLTDTSSRVFGRIVTNLMDRNKVETTDKVCHKFCEENSKFGYPGPSGAPSNPSAGERACEYYQTLFDTLHKNNEYTMHWGFDGYLLNSIPTPYDITIIDNRTCHQGKIQRKFTAYGPNNIKVTTTQTIWVIDCDPFYINSLDPCDTLDDVVWPHCGKPLVINGCNVAPPDSLKPKMMNDSCSLLSIEYGDNIFANDPDYCFTIIRQWTVIDWCQYDPNISPVIGRWTYDETIHVKDEIAPDHEIFFDDCSEADSTGLSIYTFIADISSDNCTPNDWILYTYFIDKNNDGIGKHNGFDFQVGPLSIKDYNAGKKPLIYDNPYASNKINPTNATGNYPIGKHKILFETEDGCGNISKDSVYFSIIPSAPPTFECPGQDYNFQVDLPNTFVFNIKNIINLYEDNCTPYPGLKVFLDGDSTKTKDLINCLDYVDNGSRDTLKRNYKAWVQDASGNATICPIHVNYIFNGNCDSLKTKNYNGKFYTLKNKEIEELNLNINTTSIGSLSLSSGCDNSFTISAIDSDTGYYLLANKHDFFINGVDVLDIVKMRKHILGIEFLKNKLSLLAADVNNSNNVTTSDIVLLSRRIVGILNGFTLESDGFWKFANAKDTLFTNPSSLITDSFSTFIGSKTGDINGDALSKCGDKRIKPNTCLNLTTEPIDIVKGKSYLVPIFSSNYNDIYGMQASFQYKKEIIQIDTVKKYRFLDLFTNLNPSPGIGGVFGFIHEYRGEVERFSTHDTLFAIKITALENYTGNDFLKVIDDPTYSIAYDKDENPLDICLNGISTSTLALQSDHFIIYPNPTTGKFYIKSESITDPVKICISNAAGKMICTKKVSEINPNGILIDELSECLPGIYFISIQTRDHVKSEILVKL